jgi:hypothetical protein
MVVNIAANLSILGVPSVIVSPLADYLQGELGHYPVLERLRTDPGVRPGGLGPGRKDGLHPSTSELGSHEVAGFPNPAAGCSAGKWYAMNACCG